MKKLFTRLVPALVVLFLLSFCAKEFNGERPFVRLFTLAPSDLNDSGVTLHGQILDLSGAKITDYGFIIDSKKIEPDVVKNPNALRFSLAQETAKVGAFSYRVESHIVKDVTYYVRAYVQQDNKVLVLGEEFSFISQGGVAVPSFTDFSPTNIVPGDTLTLTGKDFILGLPKLTAKVGGVAALIIDKPTNTSLKIQVPLGVPTTGKIELSVGSIVLNSSKTYQRAAPVIVNLPRNIKYGTPFFIECQNLGKFPLSNQVKIWEDNCIILEQQKNGLLCKLDDSKVYQIDPFGVPLTVAVESLISASKNLIISPPTIASVAPSRGIAGDEIVIICDGIANSNLVTNVNWSGRQIGLNTISIQSAGKLIRLKVPPFTDYPQELVITVRSGQLESNPLTFQLNPQLVGLSASQKNWNYAFSLGNKVYIGTPKAGTPFEGFEPSYIQASLSPVTANFNQTFEYAIPLQNNQILTLNKGTNGGEGHLVNLQSNNTAQLVASSNNQIPLETGTSGLGLTEGVFLQPNQLAYLYVGNATQGFWEFNPTTRQFKALTPLPTENGTKPSELVFFDQGSKLLAIASYPGNSQAQVLEYIPAINTWRKLYQIPLNGLIANDGFTYKHPIEPGPFYILSFLGQDHFVFGNEEYLLHPNVPLVYRKQQANSKKRVFLINENVIVVDDASIYRTKLIIN